MLFEVENILLEFGGGFDWVEVFDVRERGIRNGMVKEADRVAREQAAVHGQGNVRGRQPRDFRQDSGRQNGGRHWGEYNPINENQTAEVW